MASLDETDYETKLWPPLENAVNMLLTQQPGVYLKISYEEMYRYVYTSVCHQHSARIYEDLVNLLSENLSNFSQKLENLHGVTLLDQFHSGLKRYTQAIGCIVPIFAYLNRTYIMMQMKSDLKKELTALLNKTVIDHHVLRVLDELSAAQSKPFGCSPAVAADLVRNLNDFRPDFARIYPHLFAKYIPNILPPARADELPLYIEETHRMQQELVTSDDFRRCDQSKKRALDDTPVVPR